MSKLSTASSAVMLMTVLVVVASFAGVVYAEPVEGRVEIGDVFTVTSYRGVAFAAENGETVKKTASLHLTIQVIEAQEHMCRFKITSGTVNVDGTSYAIASGTGRAGFDERPRLVALNATMPNGEIHLRGRYRVAEGTITLVGLISIDDTLYCLRLPSTVERS